MDLKSRNKKNEFDDDKFSTSFSLNNTNDKSENIFNFSVSNNFSNELDSKLESNEKSNDELNEKIKQFDKQLINFEELLKDFEQKLCVVEEENRNKKTTRLKIGNELNSLNSKKNRNKNVDLIELDWFASSNEIIDKLIKHKPDYVIGSDIIYDPKIITDLMRVFKLCLSHLDCGLIIVCSIRNEETIKEFEQKLRQLQKDDSSIKIQRNKLSSKLSFFNNLELNNTKFVLYNIRNDESDEDSD